MRFKKDYKFTPTVRPGDTLWVYGMDGSGGREIALHDTTDASRARVIRLLNACELVISKRGAVSWVAEQSVAPGGVGKNRMCDCGHEYEWDYEAHDYSCAFSDFLDWQRDHTAAG